MGTGETVVFAIFIGVMAIVALAVIVGERS